MQLQSIGSQWLKERYKLPNYNLTHCSYIGSNPSIELTSKGNVEQVYGTGYRVSVEDALHHLEFSLKYDDLNLDFLKAVYEKMEVTEIAAFVASSPASKYARKIGFLYEFLTGRRVDLVKAVSGNLLDIDDYVTGQVITSARWRINNNLLGTQEFCPIVRKTKEINDLLSQDIRERILDLKDKYPLNIYKRAINYLYRKETKSSYEIEKEEPSPDRMEKFVGLLEKAGMETVEEMLDKKRLVKLQNAIVDPRFAATEFRDFQNYIGESLPTYQENIHYICPPPGLVESLMKGLRETASKANGISPEIRAALVAFGFVFIHPFEDGNGRLHRFLIHDILVQDGVVPQGWIIPVSAHMLNYLREYDAILERYSKPLMQRARYEKTAKEEIRLTNEKELIGYYRYPDLTDHCIYLMNTIRATIKEDMQDELQFIQRYDEAKKEIQHIVDMPDKLISMMLTFLHQNEGIFPKRRREHFKMLTDEEIQRMQRAYRMVYELDPG
jgi:hypothetical protein